MSPESEHSVTASQRAMLLIRDRISSGDFAPLSQLPRETDLALQLGVSRGALREAIRALQALGVIESRHGSGTYVTGLQPSDLLPALGWTDLLQHGRSAIELAEFRRVIEPTACGLAVDRASAEEKSEIRRIHEQMQSVTDPREYAALDGQFHQAIVTSTGNGILSSVLTSLAYGDAWKRMWRAATSDVIPERTRREHEALVTALETGDRDLAIATAHAHISSTQRLIREVYEKVDNE
jgi:GntR family transcriptional regulator, transcriptional repressor for pyruvate dehydrogenase complex